MNNFGYVMTFSLQMTGFILLAEKIIILSRSVIITKYVGDSKCLNMEKGKAYISKENYVSTFETIYNIYVGTILSFIGVFMTIFDFQSDLSILNKIIYSTSLICLFMLITVCIKKIIILNLKCKYKNNDKIELNNCEVPDGTMAMEVKEDK